MWMWIKGNMKDNPFKILGRCGRNRMVVGFTTTFAIIAYHHSSGELESHS